MKYVVMRCLKMDINKALSNIDFFKVTKVIIAPSAPKFF